MAASRQQRKVEKKQKIRLTKEQKAQREEILSREKALKEKAEAFYKEQEELNALRRKAVMEGVKAFSFDVNELDAFVSGLDNFPGKHDLAIAISNAAQTKGVNMANFNTKLTRLGFL